MSALYDTVEPSVVDEEMLLRAVQEQGPQGQAGCISKEEGLHYDEVFQLRLDYRNILKIDHLWQFTSLTRLQLDNNVIEKIEGLECLTNLVWLGLSFNNIEVIEGLDALVKLQDLSLYSNRISTIENMDSLVNLHVLSLGNNFLAQLENVTYLRKFKNLRSLNLSGNPICDDECYKLFVAAYLPDLVYLDYRLMDEKTLKEAQGKYQYAIEEMRHNESQGQRALEAKDAEEAELQHHREAFVEFLNGPQLFDSLYADDPEAAKLVYMPGVSQLQNSYRNQLVALCVQVFEMGLAQHGRREAEVNSFFGCWREAVDVNQERAAKIAADFEKGRREMLGAMQQVTDPKLLQAQVDQCREEISQLSDTLMALELQLVDQLEEIIKDFERNISDMVAGFIEAVQGIFAQCRDLENHHHEKLLEVAVETLERVAKNELEEEKPEDVRLMFLDKETLLNAVGASHDTHLLKIDNREDALVTGINGWVAALIKSIHDEEVKRNRKRVSEIQNYIDFVRDHLAEIHLHDPSNEPKRR